MVFARFNPASNSVLDPASLRVEGDGLGSFRVGQDGILQSDTVTFDRLKQSPTTVSVAEGVKGRGIVSIEGVLLDPKAGYALPKGAIRRRIFNITDGKSVKEIETKNNIVNVKIGELSSDSP